VTIAHNLATIRQSIATAAQGAKRSPDDVLLLAVSKVQPADAIREAYAAGQRDFGESYVQELLAKQQELQDLPELRWHFIGHLQRNKARHVVGPVAAVQSVDSPRLLTELATRGRTQNCVVDVLLQVNLVGEATKSGCSPAEATDLFRLARETEGVAVRGLMTLPPYESNPEATRPYFVMLRQLRDELGGPELLPELSMGMSHDYRVAIEEGATIVRVGTAIFGPRPPRRP
jgi:pyridoxal phosphate enzyme (YggS family)